MNEEKNISDRKKEIIFYKFIALINKGYSIKYCETKFAKYKSMIDEYLPIIEQIKKLKRNDLSDDFLKNTLSKIYSDKSTQDVQISYNNKHHRTSIIVKPAIIFLSALIFFSFSFVGAAYASQSSIPGDFLYPVKRSVENVKLLMYPESKENTVHFQLLNNRIDEAKILINSSSDISIKTGDLLEEIDNEFNQLKKGNYFGNKSEKEVKDLVNDIKEKYKDKIKQKKNQDEKKEKNNSINQNNGNDKKDQN
jgi:hypothetical protein